MISCLSFSLEDFSVSPSIYQPVPRRSAKIEGVIYFGAISAVVKLAMLPQDSRGYRVAYFKRDRPRHDIYSISHSPLSMPNIKRSIYRCTAERLRDALDGRIGFTQTYSRMPCHCAPARALSFILPIRATTPAEIET